MSVSRVQKTLHKYRTTLKMCRHESDYAILYDYMEMDHLLRHSCWTEEKPVRMDEDTVKIYRPRQLRAVRVPVHSLQHRRHGAEGVYGMFSGTLDSHATALNGDRHKLRGLAP